MQVAWSPNHEDKFFTFGTDLCLYRVNDLRDLKVMGPKEEGMKISDRIYASLMSIATDVQYRCVAWRPNSTPDHLLAVGLNSGQVMMSCFGKAGSHDPLGLVGKDFLLRHPRACNFLQWNPVETYLLAEGVDRYRQDASILIWDVCSQPSDISSHSERKSSSANMDWAAVTKPLYELGASETSNSLAWFFGNPRTLVAGMNSKSLRIYDLRDQNRPQAQAATKCVHSISVDKLFENRIASYFENQLTVWDVRSFDKPVVTLQHSKNFLKVAWSPTRTGLLACINKDSPTLHVYDFQQFVHSSDELEPAYVERYLLPASQNYISSFDWHPTQSNRVLTVTQSGAVSDVRLTDRIAMCWSPDINLTWAHGNDVSQFHSFTLPTDAANIDASVKMRQRSLNGYGIANLIEDNIRYVEEEENLHTLWRYISRMKDLGSKPDNSRIQKKFSTFSGIKSILRSVSPSSPAEPEFTPWQEIVDRKNAPLGRHIFRSEERAMALELCDWSLDTNGSNFSIIDKLERDCKYEKAAAAAVFNLKLKRAINILKKGGEKKTSSGESQVHLNMYAMALSGYTDETDTMWKELCSNLNTSISNPYLRAMFNFLSTDDDSYEDILTDPDLELCDRVAFSCLYLPDDKLLEYVEGATSRYIAEGNPCGILLTGLTEEGVELFASYVDRTCDIQTAVVALIQAFPTSDLGQNGLIRLWINMYREFLDRMRLWKERAEFDVFLGRLDKTKEPEVQVYISCNFCGKSISFESLANRNRVLSCNAGSGPPIKPRIASCPSCRKPLPRCALCRLHMGTSAGMSKGRPGTQSYRPAEMKLSEISDWFTWCQSCHHGGHAEHLTTWFKDHVECPVAGCACHCTAADIGTNLAKSYTTSMVSA